MIIQLYIAVLWISQYDVGHEYIAVVYFLGRLNFKVLIIGLVGNSGSTISQHLLRINWI